MGWELGERDGRDIGYGVPAVCDHPDCSEEIDRGVSYACRECGLFFCESHLYPTAEEDDYREYPGDGLCERCRDEGRPFDPKPDVAEWANHKLSHPSWQQWRDENPEAVARLQVLLCGGEPS